MNICYGTSCNLNKSRNKQYIGEEPFIQPVHTNLADSTEGAQKKSGSRKTCWWISF